MWLEDFRLECREYPEIMETLERPDLLDLRITVRQESVVPDFQDLQDIRDLSEHTELQANKTSFT